MMETGLGLLRDIVAAGILLLVTTLGAFGTWAYNARKA